MNLKRSIASGFALLAAATAGSARADEDFIRNHMRGPHPALAPSGYHQIVEPTVVTACSRDGWLVETSYEILAHDELLRISGGPEPFRRRYRDGLNISLKELINGAVANRTGSRAMLFPQQEEAAPDERSITSELAEGIGKLLSPLEKDGKARLIVSLSTVHIQPNACSPR